MIHIPERRWVPWALDVLPAWIPSASRAEGAEQRRVAREGYEQRHGAGWLTAYYREHGTLPEPVPPNPAAAGNGVVVELCPQQREELVSSEADWALCSDERAVRAMAREVDRVADLGVPRKQRLFPD